MSIKRRIFVSSPRDDYLDDRRNELKWAIIDEIEKGEPPYEAQVYGSPDGGRGLAAEKAWSAENAAVVMRRCVGAAVLGFPIWTCASPRDPAASRSISLVTEYCHYEGALARALGLPILAVLEEGAEERVFFARHASDPVIRVPRNADQSWATQATFQRFLERWKALVRERRDLFLAYSSRQLDTALSIAAIAKEAGVSVLDWREFAGGKTILQQIERAAKITTGGIFLFTRDDLLEGDAGLAAPRDNVIFEAGFFAHAKGHERVLIIREEGAKMPADLGGVIYEPLATISDSGGLAQRVHRFIEEAM
jgi:hypothetical protein